MIASILTSNHCSPFAKRQKLGLRQPSGECVYTTPESASNLNSSQFRTNEEHQSESSTLGLSGPERHFLQVPEEEEERLLAKEDGLLNRVLTLYDQYEADTLFRQSELRSQISVAEDDSPDTLEADLQKEKDKSVILKVLTLLLQCENGQFIGSCHKERVDLMYQIKQLILQQEQYSLTHLKICFRSLLSYFNPRFPPTVIMIPTPSRLFAKTKEPCTPPLICDFESMQKQLQQKTRKAITKLQRSAHKCLEERLNHHTDWQFDDDADFGDEKEAMMIAILQVWIQFPAESEVQAAILQDTLSSPLTCWKFLLSNLAYYLSLTSKLL